MLTRIGMRTGMALSLAALLVACDFGVPKEKLGSESDKGASYDTTEAPVGSGWRLQETVESHHPYGNNEDHTFTVTGPPLAEKMKVHFTGTFDLERGYDYLYIYDKNGDQVGPALTGPVVPADIEVNGNEVRLRLVTDYSVTRHGFTAEVFSKEDCNCPLAWAPVCGVDGKTYGNACMASCEGVEILGFDTCENRWHQLPSVLESDHPYSKRFDHTWTIREGGASQIRVHFEQIRVENNYDYLYVLDGEDNVVAQYTGHYLDEYSPMVRGDTIKIRLVTDHSVQDYGFKVDRYEVMGGCYRDEECGPGNFCHQVQCFRAPCFKMCMPMDRECGDGLEACPNGYFCDYGGENGGQACDVRGSCRPVCDPTVARLAYIPVCGCNDEDYSSLCFAWAEETSVQYRGECGNPHCGAIGSRSEGWFGQNGHITWDNCAGAWAVCQNPGTPEEGWYRNDTGALILLEECAGEQGQTCSDIRPCAGGLKCEGGICEIEPPPGDCQPTGCSGQICSDEMVITTCEYRDYYACYQSATCERQSDGQCGWTMDSFLQTCLDRYLGADEGHPCGGSIGVSCKDGLICAGLPEGVIGGTGTCRTPCSTTGPACPADFVCNIYSDADQPGVCAIPERSGHCEPVVQGCPEIYHPVCGCNGTTYSNDCERTQAGVALDHDGACSASFQSADTPLVIPDNSTGGVSSEIHVAGVGSANIIRVSLQITHSWRGDLRVVLEAPNGQTVTLHDRDGGSTDNLLLIDHDVGASFPGLFVDGTWKLKVYDLAAWDTGTLEQWSLSFGG